MNSPLYLEAYAQDVLRERLQYAAQAALAAQLPPTAFPRPDIAIRTRVAHGLRALAIRLDPCAALETPTLVALSSR